MFFAKDKLFGMYLNRQLTFLKLFFPILFCLFLVAFSLTFDLAVYLPTVICSDSVIGNLNFAIYTFDIRSDVYSDFFLEYTRMPGFYLTFYLAINLAFYLTYILDTLSEIYSGILSDILSGIRSCITPQTVWPH